MILRMFGIGITDAIAGGQTVGTVMEVKPCYWLKVNSKQIRTYAGDGALYPHLICFTYHVGGQTYTGKRYVHWNKRCPIKGEKITVHYEAERPQKYAVIV